MIHPLLIRKMAGMHTMDIFVEVPNSSLEFIERHVRDIECHYDFLIYSALTRPAIYTSNRPELTTIRDGSLIRIAKISQRTDPMLNAITFSG
jgi:hypothetical protein